MQASGLSMAMGAFLAGVLLSESTFRHQLEADIEPFRGLLLGLFFLGVGMALDLNIIVQNWTIIAISVPAYMILKMAVIYGVARLTKARQRRSDRTGGADGAGRRVCVRALRGRDSVWHPAAGMERDPDRNHHHFNGADAAFDHLARPADAKGFRFDGRRRRRPRISLAGCF
jgi:hypothetical protein